MTDRQLAGPSVPSRARKFSTPLPPAGLDAARPWLRTCPSDHDGPPVSFQLRRRLSTSPALRSFRSEILACELRRWRIFQGQDHRCRRLGAGRARCRRYAARARIDPAQSFISKRWPRRWRTSFFAMTPLRVDLALVAAAGLLAWLLIAFVRRPLTALLLLLGIAVAYLAIGPHRLRSGRAAARDRPVLTAFLLSGLFSLGYEYAMERHRETSHPAHTRALRLEKSRKRDSR